MKALRFSPFALKSSLSIVFGNAGRAFLPVMLIASSVGSASAQNVYLDNSRTNCEHKVKVFYGQGGCHEGHHWICSGAQSWVMLTVSPGNTVYYSLPPQTGVCGYEIYDWNGAFLTSCIWTTIPTSCNFGPYEDCSPRERTIDMNSACENGVNTGTVKWN